MMFKSNFILWIIVELAWFGLHLSFIQFLYLQVDTVAGWSKWGMILLVSTNNLIMQIFQTFVMINLTKLPELIRTGKLDFFLAQPAPAQFLISTRNFEPGSVVNGIVASIVCVVAMVHLDVNLSGAGLLVFPILVACGVIIHYSLMLALMSLAFWMTRAQGFINAYYNCFQIARLPREAFHGPGADLFHLGGAAAAYRECPRRTRCFTASRSAMWRRWFLVTAVLLALSTAVFQAGLRRYGRRVRRSRRGWSNGLNGLLF